MYGHPGAQDDLDVQFADGDHDPSDLMFDDTTFWLDQRAIESCPHGYSWEDCNECMAASDLAYDLARESGWRKW